MSYTIWYGENPAEQKKRRTGKICGAVLAVLLMLGAVWGVLHVESWDSVREVFLPGNAVQAFSNLSDNLRSGKTLGESVSVFCQEIVDDAMENKMGH